ncbi:hypothetical protein B0T26DRAFT_754759 [Lasiosphaeria miniovina]|uniref:Uncharacterized protein n=1 Tax=Lasiosphaeria miniovina TaxID=1954250 RepID=A0AA40DRR6_9PEZI|nr:uncharacterized protein B0T26DRAFT_754759 [Lasiosphaeria miniovina]KAK0709578.1 hypothetical protein B0T26DRAFT_754759 [Lasiosphaeria miniovina]
MAKDEAVLALLAHVLSGALGAPAGRGMSGLCADRDGFQHILVAIQGDLVSGAHTKLSEMELAEVTLSVTGQYLASRRPTRSTDGALGSLYKATAQETAHDAYVARLRHRGN